MSVYLAAKAGSMFEDSLMRKFSNCPCAFGKDTMTFDGAFEANLFGALAKFCFNWLTSRANNRGFIIVCLFATVTASGFFAVAFHAVFPDWANAEKAATDALASGIGVFQTNANYIASWRAAINPESMFEINYQTNENVGVNTSLQTTYTTLVELGNRTKTGGFGDLVPSANFLAIIVGCDCW